METRTLSEELGVIVRDLESISRRLSAIEERQVQPRHGSNIISLMKESQDSVARGLGKLFPRDEILDRLPFIEIQGTEMAYMPDQQQQNRPLERLQAEFDWLPWEGQELRKKEALKSLVEQFHHLFFCGNLKLGALLGVTRGGIKVIRDVDRGKGLLQWDVGVLHKDLRCLGKIDGIWNQGNVTC